MYFIIRYDKNPSNFNYWNKSTFYVVFFYIHIRPVKLLLFDSKLVLDEGASFKRTEEPNKCLH